MNKLIIAFFSCLFLLSGVNSFAAELNCNFIIKNDATNTPEENFKKAYCHIERNDLNLANVYLERIGNKLPELQDNILYYKSLYLKESGNKGRAKRFLKRIIKNYSTSSIKENSNKLLAEIYVDEGNFDLAETIYRQLINEATSKWTKAKHLKSLGEIYELKNSRNEAFSIYKEIWTNYSNVSFANYIFEFARKNGLVFVPDKNDYLKRANFFYERSVWQNARIEFEKSPQTKEVLTKMGVCDYKLRRYSKAIDVLSKVKSAESVYWIANATKRIGYEFEAAKMLSSIHKIYPGSEFASLGLFEAAKIYEDENRTSKAINFYKELAAKYPTSEKGSEGAWNLGWLYYHKQKNYSNALSVFSNHSFPEDSFDSDSFKYWKAKTLEKLGRKTDAYLIFKQLAASKNITYHSFLSRLKTGYKVAKPEGINITSTNVFPGILAKKKVDTLLQMGIYEIALDEASFLESISTNLDEDLYIASIHYRVGNYYSSIKSANENRSHVTSYLSYPKGFSTYVDLYSQKYNLDKLLVYSLIREESRFDERAVSSSNARGLMQLIPVTARETARKVGVYRFSLDKLFIPKTNVEMGCYYLRFVLDRFSENIPIALAGYNAGPTRAAEWYEAMGSLPFDEFIEEIPFRETEFYVKRIIRSYGAYQTIYGDK